MTVRTSFGGSWFAILITAAIAAPAAAESPASSGQRAMTAGITHGHALLRAAMRPRAVGSLVAIIIDDLGEQHAAGARAVALPGPVALAFLPDAAHTRAQAARAHVRGKEVLLHLPLEPGGGARRYPTAITVGTLQPELAASFRAALASVPFASGVNNHQGSLLTERAEPMAWLLAEFAAHPGLYFVDSRTSPASVAYGVARSLGVPAAQRNVFLDNVRGEDHVRRAFRALLAKARRSGRALAIGHPYPETFKVLEEELPNLARYGVELVAPSELIARQAGRRAPLRRLKLSPTLTLATRPATQALPAAMSAAGR